MYLLRNFVLRNINNCFRGYVFSRKVINTKVYCLSYCDLNSSLIKRYLHSTFNNNSFKNTSDESDDDGDVNDEMYDEIVKKTFRTPDMSHQVFVIQPYIKWGPLKKRLTNPENQLAESVALIETLDNWKVVEVEKISLESFKHLKFFGKGNLEVLQERIHKNNKISAVFISVNRLNYVQQEFLEETFGVPVYDRYNIVIQIFHKHAITKEAKLQVAMAEIPFMWYRIKSVDDKGGGGSSYTGGSGETLLELKKRILTDKEQKIKKALKKLTTHRTIMRSKRKSKEYPVIAVVGYTNAGKTSLIKALTAEKSLTPRNKLFATLDVTLHEGILPSNVKVLFVDTIGFISDIPTELIEPFRVTLEDAVQSDVVVHVMDISNPDVVAQAKHVVDTLHSLNLNDKLLSNVINVANKCDLVNRTNENLCEMFNSGNQCIGDIHHVSCVNGTGLNELRNTVEKVMLLLTGRIRIKIRIKCGGPEFSWLHKESSVIKVISDKDPQFVYMDVIITETNLMKFKHIFINSRQYRNS